MSLRTWIYLDANHPKVYQELTDDKASSKGAAGRKLVTLVSSLSIWTRWLLRSVMWKCGIVPASIANASTAWAVTGTH